ncbi:MBL fold metallo-hydrolase [Paenibacillus cremeus]|uniref:MBL fold metallo-hydrolase n=1 Tax=Paenibacillus cremeus TaxID=2163881 RepID=A0A559K576_9BACL|nr:MBL fold metallo-hydrolase [Paenibacillus cremeus]TVY07284.1 MBL fold metallo-hydrolase [Paenibacillus cremeus]
MLVANGLEMLDITAHLMGEVRTIHPTLLWDEHTVILVDTGYPGQLPLFREAIEKAGVPFERLDRIIMTHQDIDHIGSLPAILKESSHPIEVLAHEIEKPYIQGEKRLIKFSDEMVAQIEQWPEERRKPMLALISNLPKADVHRTIEDGEELPYCGGLTVITTPGHTPGHTSLYHRGSKTLIAGDALNVIDRQLTGSIPQYSTDPKQAVESLKKLAAYDIETVICYHGGVFRGNANERIAELANANS